MNITLVDDIDGSLAVFTLPELLEEINRDRSMDWTDYDMNSTLQEIVEVVEEFTNFSSPLHKVEAR